jgi:hypothetical protein
LSVAPTGTGINMVELNRRSADYLTSWNLQLPDQNRTCQQLRIGQFIW